MIINEHNSFDLLREPGERPDGQQPELTVEEEAEEKESGPENYILCRQCHQVVTTNDDRMAMEGSHRHTFANPHGIVFEIGCFKSIIGCGYAGPLSDEFTWFKGYGWRIAVCGMCLTHLGWLFVSGSGNSFHGLILDRLIEPRSEG